MKTNEFIDKVEALGYAIRKDGAWIRVSNSIDMGILKVNKDYPSIVFLTHDYTDSGRINMLNVAVEYTNTPEAEREKEKRYYLRKVPITLLGEGDEDLYLMIDLSGGSNGISYIKKGNTQYFKTVFTESELAQMDITGFMKVEVSE
jgi:hypothetical protein